MKIGIDARMMGKGFGLARYVEQLVTHVLSVDQNNEYVLFLKKEQFLDPHLLSTTSVPYAKVLADIPWYSLKEQTTFLRILNKHKVDLMHFPHWNIPYFFHGSYVVTIHDLTMFHYPRAEATTLGPVKFWIKDQAHRALLRKIVQKSKHILAVSEFTKKDIHETLHVPLSKITVTYQAPFQIQHTKKLIASSEKPYVLYVGAAYPHKNLETLLMAWGLFQKKYGNAHELVLVGKENYFYEGLKKKFPPDAFQNTVRYLGFASDDQLTDLYKSAELFVFPSLYEGFGLPPLEAMAQGVPVLASQASCLPEVLKDSALFFDPTNPKAIAESVHTVLENNTLKQELIRKGFEHVKQFSWKELAQKTIHAYESS